MGRQVKQEDKATLTLEERDGEVVLKAAGGKAVPTRLRVTDDDGGTCASYTLDTADPGALSRETDWRYVNV